MEIKSFRRMAAVLAACAVITAPMSTVSLTVSAADGITMWGDANCDSAVDMGDAVIIMQALANPNKYGINGSDSHHISEQGLRNADVYEYGSSLTSSDALSVQKYLLHLIKELPESYLENQGTTTTTTTTSTWTTPPTTTTTTTTSTTSTTTTTTTTTSTTTTTTTTPTTTSTTTTTRSPLGITDYGTPMNSSATMVEDFRDGSSRYFIASDGWENGDPFDCGWYASQTSLDKGCLTLSIDRDYSGKYNYAGAEYRTNDFYQYGYYETSMQAIKNDGVVSSFFTYTGPSDNNPWDEIDIEILGKDTTQVQFNYYTNGQGKHEKMYSLGFDASQGFHTYGFDWQPDHITWYVDGKAVYTANDNIPRTAGKIMMNTWPGRGVDEWLNRFNGRTPLTAYYQWVTYNKDGAPNGNGGNNQQQNPWDQGGNNQWQNPWGQGGNGQWQNPWDQGNNNQQQNPWDQGGNNQQQNPWDQGGNNQQQNPWDQGGNNQQQNPWDQGNNNQQSNITASGLTDYGTAMNTSATMADDFRNGSSRYFIASDGWENGDPFDCGWYKSQTAFKDGALTLSIDKDYSGKYNYAGAEYRTNDFYSFGYYETSMQAIKNDGVVSSFFTYTGPSDNNPWDEIDIEILGKDTTKVQFNYYTNGKGQHEKMYDLGFDASQGYHTFGFDWQRDHITWYVDGKPVYTAYDNIPQTPGKIMMNTWPGRGVDDWLNHYNGRTPLTARYQWVTYNKQ